MKVKIELDTMTDIKDFIQICSTVPEPVHLTDGDDCRVSAKSLMGAIYTFEWNEVYCECKTDIYEKIARFVI